MKKATEIILALVIIGTTLAFGGVQPIAYSLMELALLLAMLVFLVNQMRQGRISLDLSVWPVLFALLVMLQLIPLPYGLVVRLSPGRLLDPDLAGLPQAEGIWRTLSIYPHDTWMMLIKVLAYLCAFALAASTFNSRRGKSNLLRGLVVLGCLEAVYGIVQYLTGWQKIFTYEKQFNVSMATGTYINYNHYAGFLELAFPFVLAAAYYSFQTWADHRRTGPARRSSRASLASFQAIFGLFVLLIMVVAVILSRSRMGILSTIFTIVFVALLAQLKVRQKAWVYGIFLFLVIVVGYGLWIGLEPLLARFEQMRDARYLEEGGRLILWKDALPMIRESPLFGTGLGTFGVAFRRHQTVLVQFFVDHAHNDYLQFAVETGLVGAALLFLPILYLFGRMIRSFLDDPNRFRRAVTLGCIGSTLALLLHSLTDFNLQIPANALIFAVVLGIAYKAVYVEREKEGRVDAGAGGQSQEYPIPNG